MRNSLTQRSGRPHGSPASRTATICVVDPRADDYEGWRLAAYAHGVQLQILGSAAEALRLSRRQPVDLWVLSSELPGLSGADLCGMLKARSPAVPVYVVAECYSPAVEQAARQARATLFGLKPEHHGWLDAWAEQLTTRRTA